MQTRVPQTAAQLRDSLYNVFSTLDNVTQESALKLVEVFARGATAAHTDAETFGTAVLGVLNAYPRSMASFPQRDEAINLDATRSKRYSVTRWSWAARSISSTSRSGFSGLIRLMSSFTLRHSTQPGRKSS